MNPTINRQSKGLKAREVSENASPLTPRLSRKNAVMVRNKHPRGHRGHTAHVSSVFAAAASRRTDAVLLPYLLIVSALWSPNGTRLRSRERRQSCCTPPLPGQWRHGLRFNRGRGRFAGKIWRCASVRHTPVTDATGVRNRQQHIYLYKIFIPKCYLTFFYRSIWT